MKRTPKLLILAFLLAAMSAHAGKVTESQALQRAQQFMAGKTFTPAESHPLTRGGLVRPDTLLYVFNAVEKGFVIVSGDDAAMPILGYSYDGEFDLDNIPEHVKSWIEGYEEQLAYLKEHPEAATKRTLSEPAIDPLLGNIQWNQDSPYNDLCPMDGTKRSYTGCVATAMAQVMYYHRWPQQTTKEIPGYTTTKKGFQISPIPVRAIEWDKMLPKYNGTNGSEAQQQAVAELMQMCGSSVKMNYASDGSGASQHRIANALVEYFDYDVTARLVSRSGYTLSQWNRLLYDELSQGRPVCYTGCDFLYRAHEFVIDGYGQGDFFHVNWGWGGSNDGYFLLSILDSYHSDDVSLNYSGTGWSWGQDAVIGIQKPVPFSAVLGVSGMTLTEKSVTRTSADEDFRFSFSFYCNNNTAEDRDFEYSVGLFDDSGHFISSIAEVTERNVSSGEWPRLNCSVSFGANSTEGTFLIKAISREKGNTTWKENIGSNLHYIRAEITGNVLNLSIPSNSGYVALTGEVINTTGYVHGEQSVIYSTITNKGDNFNNTIYFLVDNKAIGARHLDIAPQETKEVGVTYTPNSVGSHTFCIAYLRYNSVSLVYEYVPFLTGTINVANPNAIYLEMTPAVTNETDGIVSDNIVKLNISVSNISKRDYDDDIRCSLYKYDGNSASYYSAANKHLTLRGGQSTELAVDISDVKEGRYTCSCQYKDGDEWKTTGKSIYVTVQKQGGDALITFADEQVERICVYYWDTDGDDKLSRSEAAAVTSLGDIFCLDPNRQKSWQTEGMPIDDLNHGDLTSFDELQYFTGLTSIDEGAFYGQLSLRSVTLPESVKSIGKNAFYYCANLQSIHIPNSTETIGDYAFRSCKQASELTLGASVKTIGEGAFAECSSIQEVVVPEGCTTVGRMAFSMASSLKKISIPKSVDHIGCFAFGYPASPLDIHIADLEAWMNVQIIYHDEYDIAEEEGLLDDKSSYRLYLNGAEVTSVEIPGKMTEVSNLLQGCISLASITIHREVTGIAGCAFRGCRNLGSVISYIADPFYVSSAAFENRDEATGEFVFTSATLYVPKGTAAKYKDQYFWKNFREIVEMDASGINSVTLDGSGSGHIYDLQGRRLAQPAKGMNIINGRKVVVK